MDRLTALVLLRWRMELRSLAWARERLVGLLLMLPFLLVGSAVTAFLAYVGIRGMAARSPEILLPALSLLVSIVGLFWALSPLLAGVALTESHDVSRLLHFPIPLPTLVASSLIANLAQPLVIAGLPVLLAIALALAGAPARLPLVAGGLAESLVFCLAAAQVVGLALHGLSRNRRLHDLSIFLSLGFGFALSLAPIALLASGGRPLRLMTRLFSRHDLFALSPFAWGVRAAVHAGRGEALPFLLHAAAGILAIAGAMALSTLLIHRIHRGELDLGGLGPGATGARARMRFAGAVGALLEKDLRASWRDPGLKATLIMGLFGPLLFLLFLSQAGGPAASGTTILLLASFVGISTFGANAFGFERRGISLLMGFPVERWRILLAKNLAAIVFRLPGVLTALVAAVFLAPLAYVPATATIALVTLLISAGVDNYMSILFPVTVPEPGKNPYGGAASGGRGLGVAMLGTLFLMGALLVASPFVFLAWLPPLLGSLWLWVVSLPLALAGAGAVYAMLVAGAERVLSRREPELLERILGEA